ncbi:phosphatase PAP2 family protein [Sinorhizobium alkalisoli]|uniref:phosphatase PAP2 family protein n=1 Tax=Sinorhizobium alkalisoli TaxID=1752398 RepID=UPI001AEE6F7C|nr:phosphatase PAP2 family protein [Sinorhizobium alkalisoli]MCG5479714.1 phosphatase PAP2 family protein [Sinorhizobium alkalisoli]
MDLSAYLRPLGIEEKDGYDATVGLLLLVLLICDEIGMRYKERFAAARPNITDPRLRPYLPNPAHASYPSNHSFQSFAIAFVISRVIPEHPASSELFKSARRIAENREWAGLHYRSDSDAGHDLARMLMPILEVVCEEQMLAAQKEWI